MLGEGQMQQLELENGPCLKHVYKPEENAAH